MYDDSNIFAKIIRGEMPAFKVFEDERAVAFMDAMPQSDGHTLVVPKARARNFFDIEPAALADLIKATQHVARGVQKAFNPGGMRIVQFNESVAGQTVFHIHLHLLGGSLADKQIVFPLDVLGDRLVHFIAGDLIGTAMNNTR